ncbi:type III secretion protein Q [Pseudomonas sp. JAI115]|uniref:FliM/FliN family flagellar motor switch protein n=1 Tax=Pseudomonas sp. JAI115 TaxID=2723061 RepID=UPI001621641C|nr:FliM/FliN family flagellar motor switch protein [Pseudomonas sp. JAI115]MBB6155210.1 type III secretion protein Q [Pseudomonas sp. JAI115]
MPLPQLSKAAGQLVRDIGAGRRFYHPEGSLTLRYSSGGGDGLVLTGEVDGHPLRLWMPTEQWLQWIRPQLEVPDWASLPPDLREVLCSWTLACVADSLAYAGVPWPTGLTLEDASVPISPYWLLEIEQDGRHLQAWVLDAPLPWLGNLAAALDPLEGGDTGGVSKIPVALIAGWSRIEQQTLACLQPGDGLLLQQRYPIADGVLGVFLNRPLATAVPNDLATYTLEAVMEDFNDWLNTTAEISGASGEPQADLWISVVAQVASIDVPLQQLASLQVGDVLQGSTRLEDGVLLKVAGRTIAHGLLLDIEGRLAVRIERFV